MPSHSSTSPPKDRDSTEVAPPDGALPFEPSSLLSSAASKEATQPGDEYGVYWLDARGRVQSWSEGAENLLGYTGEEILDAPFALFFPEDAKKAGVPERTVIQALEAGRCDDVGWRIRKDGSRFWAAGTLEVVLSPAGDIVGLMKVTRDLTRLQAATELLRRTDAELKLAQRIMAVGRLVSGVAHDLSNILTAIRGFAGVVAGDMEDDSPQQRALQEVMNASDRGSNLTKKLLSVGRRAPAEGTCVDLEQCIVGMDALLRRVIPAHIELRTNLAANLPAVLGSESDLELTLLNLVVNARDSIDAQGTIDVESSLRVDPAGKREDDRIVVTVRDSGCGMTQAVKQRIFEPFFSTKTQEEGTGLGLSIVQNTVIALGGSIEVDTAPGKGTEIQLFLRLAAEGELAPEIFLPKAHRRPGGQGGATVLVVDDDAAVARLVSVLLRRKGYEVLEAHSPGEALELYARNREWIEMAVVDIVMPQLSGPEMMSRIRGQRPDPPTLFLTGYSVEGEPWPVDLLPTDRLLFKPFTAETFEDEVDAILASVEERDRSLLH